ncbi:MAG TPA: ABC transporter permease [Patescibacteria group bacterium]|nr:ABC transporter permease [Patescibacteria group bacterium]
MSFGERLQKLVGQRQIIKSLAVKNIHDKYVGSALGVSWAIINPLLIMLAVTFVFGQIMKTEVRYFSLMVLSALLPWTFFLNSISESATAMVANASVLRQFVMLKEAIPLSVVAANFLNFTFGFAVVMPIFIICNPVIIRVLILLPVIICLHLIFTLGVSLLLSVAAVYFKDLPQLLNTSIMFLFWLTPIFYSLEMIPARYHWLILTNPSSCYVLIYRDLLYHGYGGRLDLWLLAVCFAAASLVGGYLVFLKGEHAVLKHI